LKTLVVHVREPRRVGDRWSDVVDRLRGAISVPSLRHDTEIRRTLGELIVSTPSVACDREHTLETDDR
jgi:hypothetical protein